MAFISVTRLRIRSVRFLPHFLWLTILSLRQARRSSGHIHSTGLRDANMTFWTLSAWDNEASMRAFMLAGAHRRAMPKLLHWCDEASIAHWNEESTELPGWREAHARMVADGRLSKVNHPSPQQLAKKIAEPKV